MNWRDTFARALAEHPLYGNFTVVPADRILPKPPRHIHLSEHYLTQADAIIAAIAGAGYRLHRDHDMQYVPPEGPYPARSQCARCGHYATDLGMPTMSCEVPE